ncbi:hypothetical protein BC938DRAFT_471078 [Jimgerdemannia flammicorona]|uniref:Uncharacterized protein n=1 Tax=Jimgerdemannia flammicorona TaxID=994334 RepID=A0A433Q8V5_9FUNG|nr:hypothetical protein BC938DRAFT_471078 [Jimgerdemannia flammicorona]
MVWTMLEGYEWDEVPLIEAESVIGLKREIRKKLAPKILSGKNLKALERLKIRLALSEMSRGDYDEGLGILCGDIDISLKAVKEGSPENTAKHLEPRASLVSVLQEFEVSVENPTDINAVRELFNKSICLFVYLPKCKFHI